MNRLIVLYGALILLVLCTEQGSAGKRGGNGRGGHNQDSSTSEEDDSAPDVPASSCGLSSFTKIRSESDGQKSTCTFKGSKFIFNISPSVCSEYACSLSANGFMSRGMICIALDCDDPTDMKLQSTPQGQDIYQLQQPEPESQTGGKQGGGQGSDEGGKGGHKHNRSSRESGDDTSGEGGCGESSFTQVRNQWDGEESACKEIKKPFMMGMNPRKCAEETCKCNGNAFQIRGIMCIVLDCDDPGNLQLKGCVFGRDIYQLVEEAGQTPGKTEEQKQKEKEEKEKDDKRKEDEEKQKLDHREKKQDEFNKNKWGLDKASEAIDEWRKKLEERLNNNNKNRRTTDNKCTQSEGDEIGCLAWGDPHYVSFDCLSVNFQGNCTYVLSEPCDEPEDPEINFHVYVTNEHRDGKTHVAFTKDVIVVVNDVVVVLLKGGEVQVDGCNRNLPYDPNGDIHISRCGKIVELTTTFGLKVTYDGSNRVTVTLPKSEYAGSLCGLCGDGDGDPANDMWMRNETYTGSPAEFGHSWVHPEYPCSTIPEDVTPPENTEECEAFDSCGMLDDPDGPFAPCTEVGTLEYIEDCVFDCSEMGPAEHGEMLCEALADYATTCQQVGVNLDWRTPDFCPYSCGPNSHYNYRMSSCPNTCADPNAEDNCDEVFVEGCECDDDYVISNSVCVPVSECGCVVEGCYFQKDETWLSDDCETRFTCVGGTVEEEDLGPCDGECVVEGGVRQCIPYGDPCYCKIIGDPGVSTCDNTLLILDAESLGNTLPREIVVESFTGLGSVTATIGYNADEILVVLSVNIHVEQSTWALYPDGTISPSPANIPMATLSQPTEPDFIGQIVTFDNGLSVRFGTYHENFGILVVTIPQKELLENASGGLCSANEVNSYMIPGDR